MPLLNYTTNIAPDKTASEIAKCLVKHGAKAVLTEYNKDEGYVSALSFQININGQDIVFKLPCDWKPILEIFGNDSKVPRARTNQEQAVRTAWRIIKNWVEAQMALVETQMVKTEQVFLPYAVMKSGKTLSEHIINNPQFLLTDKTSNFQLKGGKRECLACKDKTRIGHTCC